MNRVLSVFTITLATLGCSDVTTHLVSDRSSLDAAPAGDASNAGMDATGAGDSTISQPARCSGKVCACDNGQDDDSDDLVDGLDPECTGDADDDESSFATGSRNADDGLCLDCYWDQNSGRGDDACLYPTQCLYGSEPTMPTPGGCSSCEAGQRCVDKCVPSTPNGCDCFGCCEITRADASRVSVVLTAQCSLANLDDAENCPRCVQNTQCANPCGICELCPGRTVSDLPAECSLGHTNDDPVYTCDEGQLVCATDKPCPDDFYCHLGCCLVVLQ